jgi:hypothetical protein
LDFLLRTFRRNDGARLAYRFVANHYVGVPALVLPIWLFTAGDEYFFLVSRPEFESG